jgi:hypothetical protein
MGCCISEPLKVKLGAMGADSTCLLSFVFRPSPPKVGEPKEFLPISSIKLRDISSSYTSSFLFDKEGFTSSFNA